MGARGHLKDLTQHLALLLTLDLNLKIDIQRSLEECKKRDNAEVLGKHKPALSAVLYSVVQTAVEMWAPVSAAVAGPALEPAWQKSGSESSILRPELKDHNVTNEQFTGQASSSNDPATSVLSV